MKKMTAVLIAVSLLLLAGCSEKSENTLRVGMDLRFFPFTGMDSKAEPSGVEIDIARALGEFLEKDVEIVNTSFSMLIPALQSEEIDIIIGSMSVSEEREKTVDFSDPYLFDRIVALVNKEYADAHGVDDFMEVETFFSYKEAQFIGITGSVAVSIPQSYGFEVQSVTTDAVAEREIATGGADILVGAYTLYGMHDTNKESTIMYKKSIESASTAMAVKEGNTELLHKVNKFISQMESSGLNDRLRKDWDAEIGKKLFDHNITLDYYLSLD
ncbi:MULTISPECIES: transporter substrate-binding domain-containing protein [unclassified Oceanispirochaeta]|uniref:transporter substrate-binding domain-containing protein n=1 Tax=unclassified Oceanispirochaeta TaxID=2635722 RepID=UPI001314C4B9|nr:MULTISPECIES: transporter substrate-binding domain-containing protein [unclassified Oceanispirochaeta]MBF9016953.1 transporter substrate-binding domain-containing protein [Oceanispirochaeta sp. M2]NPD73316.1 transporter substrate-binding domain-containing protein [Oceanispirochaeta sp. M1]